MARLNIVHFKNDCLIAFLLLRLFLYFDEFQVISVLLAESLINLIEIS